MRKFSLLFALLMLLAAMCPASTYSQNITSSTSSLTITESQHGISSRWLGVAVLDGNGAVLPTTAYSYSIDHTTYSVSLTFSPSISSGQVQISGPFASQTSASTDFQVSTTDQSLPNPPYVTVCSACSSSAPAQRSYNGKGYVLPIPVVFTFSGNDAIFTGRVYILDNVIVLGVQGSGPGSITCSGPAANSCRVDQDVTAFPSGSVPLADFYYSYAFNSLTDDRPW